MNLSVFDIMAPAFFECLILVGIHSYLGLHVLRRKVIFVDLALAQIAALGTTVGFLFGILPGSDGAYWFSLFFTFIGAAIFSVARFKSDKIPQEAVIGLTYAIAAALAILVIDKAPHGAEHIKELLTGSILWVKWETIGKAAAVYSAVGLFHFVFRDKFFLISDNPAKAVSEGISVRFWDFLFYVSFGIVITHSVGTAGVLLVFVFLVVPAITSMMITDVLWKQLAIGWTMGVIVSVSGLYVSYVADLPSGPTVVVFYGAVLAIISIAVYVIRTKNKFAALKNLSAGIVVITIIYFVLIGLGNLFGKHDGSHNNAALQNEQTIPPENLSEKELTNFLKKETNILALSKLYHKTTDESLKLKIAKRITEIDVRTGKNLLKSLSQHAESPFISLKAKEELNKSQK